MTGQDFVTFTVSSTKKRPEMWRPNKNAHSLHRSWRYFVVSGHLLKEVSADTPVAARQSASLRGCDLRYATGQHALPMWRQRGLSMKRSATGIPAPTGGGRCGTKEHIAKEATCSSHHRHRPAMPTRRRLHTIKVFGYLHRNHATDRSKARSRKRERRGRGYERTGVVGPR